MYVYFISAKFKRLLGNGKLNPSVYRTRSFRIELPQGNFGNLPTIAHGYPSHGHL